jgi:ABC-type transport system involved in cytochrome bd biosynthesis fused ATPase/permease subunit
VIAHRISSALRADRVLLLDGPTPLLGTHEELLAAAPLYADLVGHWEGQGGIQGQAAGAAAVSEACPRPA